MRPLDRLFALLLECWPEQSSYIGLLIHSLREVSPEELRYVLRIGYVKAIRTLTDVIGDENLMVLEMVSFYCRYFSAKFILKQALIAKLQCVWHQIYDTSTTGSQPTSDDSVGKIAIDYTYAYAAYYVCDSPYLALGMLEKLRTATLPYLTESLTWTAEIEAFSFASTVMAQIYRQYVNVVGSVLAASNEFAKCCASMQFAIEKLEAGDRECRTRAAVLSRSLHRWLVEWKQNGQAEEEEVRYRRIRDSIPGKTCRACITERYCAGCAGALQRGITPGGLGVDGPREGCRRCNPRKALLHKMFTGQLDKAPHEYHHDVRRAPPEFGPMFKLRLMTAICLAFKRRADPDSQRLHDVEPGPLARVLPSLDTLQEGGVGDFIPTSGEIEEYFNGDTFEADDFWDDLKARIWLFHQSCDGRRLFSTCKGYIGTGPESVCVGDTIWIVAGSRIPLILRRRQGQPGSRTDVGAQDSSDVAERFSFVSMAYVHGVMEGEVLAGMEAGKFERVRDVILV